MATNISQEVAEALVGASDANVSQVVIESLIKASSAALSQVVMETLLKAGKEAHISQITIELVRPFSIPPNPIPPRVYGTIIG